MPLKYIVGAKGSGMTLFTTIKELRKKVSEKMVYTSRLIEGAYEEYYNKFILLSFNGRYEGDYFVIGVFDKKHLALAHALKELKKMRVEEQEHPNSVFRLLNKKGIEIKLTHDFYQRFEFKIITLNEGLKWQDQSRTGGYVLWKIVVICDIKINCYVTIIGELGGN